ncbi:patatin-like phospholipase family protein [Anaeromyxobacter oryzae]|uniref:PNPLA domain-containing protein n=1 Tax=Anaeromyxobacter oryzae TaxID=2918170 RepID=A0ABN6MY63_9BACT|nr:patatin-like phospholipase family protein [Anaeromyxobacter oryzae]BDG04732.1 hypothetical protein AMOR_37280 [Anaeromyxobacter oryzae]
MTGRRIALAAAVLLVSGVARSAQPPASITISGGVSLGSYEAGLIYYVVEAMRLNPAAARPKIVTGASAGSVNGFMAILQSCGGAVPDPTASLVWNAWIPLGLGKLHVPGQAQKTSAFSRAAFDAPLELIVRTWNAGLPESCDAVFGLSVTRLVPRVVTTEGERLRLPRVEEHFVVRVQGRGPGKAPRLTNYVDPRWKGEQALLPEQQDGEVVFSALVDALFASTAFPGAFPPQAVRHCVVRAGSSGARCPVADAREDLFVDGGVFDNTPVRLATRIAAAGLREDRGAGPRWMDAPDLTVRDLPPSLVLAYLSTEASTFPEPTNEPRAKKFETLLGVTTQVGGAFLATARAKNLLYVHDDSPDVFEHLIIPERHLPAASSPLGAFFGFVEGELRRFDFTLGMYDARRLAEARLGARLARAGAPPPRFPEDTPAAREAAAAWRRYVCLRAVMDGAPEPKEACAGEELRDFRIVLQTSIERLWNACAVLKDDTYDGDALCRRARRGEPVMQVPLVEPLAGDAWRRRGEENDAAYSMRLLAAHQFEFKDLGLRRDEASKAPATLRARFLSIGDSVAATQPTGQDLVVSTLVKMAADQVAYVPPRFTIWAMYGRDPEIGISKGFATRGVYVAPLRFHAALQLVGSEQLLSSEHGNFIMGVVAGAEYLPSWWSSTRLQPSLLLRGGWLFSSNDGGGFGKCPDPGSDVIGDCSRPTIQGGVAAAVLERVRLQLTANWYPPAGSGQKNQWALGPGIGVQWGF